MIQHLRDWAESHELLVGGLVLASAIMFVGTLIIVPILVSRMRADYFVRADHDGDDWSDRHPVVRLSILVLKNILGIVFLAAGILMLIMPGQGLLTVLIGLTLLSFPGKRELELWLVRRGPIIRSINWLRRKQSRPPLQVDESL